MVHDGKRLRSQGWFHPGDPLSIGEDQVYYWTKTILRRVGVNVFGGEPPGGTNDLHRIELKASRSGPKGSKGSRKFDLIAYHMDRYLLIELKDDYSKLGSDIEKLTDTVTSAAWAGAMWDNLSERGLLGAALPAMDRHSFVANRSNLLVKCLGAPESNATPPDDFLLFEARERALRVRASRFHDQALLTDIARRLVPYSF